jgi:site-specific DNA recombinase
VNKEFIYELKKMVPRPEVEILCKIALTEVWNKDTAGQDDRKQLLEEIRAVENRLSNVRDLVATKQIDPADFREMKADFSIRMDKLKAKLSACDNEQLDFTGLLNTGLKNLFRLDSVYEKGDTEKKREVISSMYPDKLIFDGDRLRTPRVNEAAWLIYNLGAGFGRNEKGQNGIISTLSSQVGKTGFEPATPWSQTRCATGLRYFPIRCKTDATNEPKDKSKAS